MTAEEGTYAYEWAMRMGYVGQPFAYTVRDDEYAVITAYRGTESAVTVPETIAGLPVRSVGMQGNDKIVSVVLPSSLTKLEYMAFRNCTSLESVTMSGGMETIGEDAFWNCTSLTSVVLPPSLKSISSYAFEDCTALETITLPASLAKIDRNAFLNSGLRSVHLPAGLTEIDDKAFAGCENLTVTANPGTYAYAWAIDNGYIKAEMPASMFRYTVESGETVSITGYTGKQTDVWVPERIEGLPVASVNLRGYSAITSVRLPSSLKTIGAFEGCYSLKEITIPEGVTALPDHAFDHCYALRRVSLPSTLKSIGTEAFDRCTGLTEIVIPEGVTDMSNYVFFGCSALKRVSLPSTIRIIWEHTFNECSALEEITIPEGVTRIGNLAFAFCYKLASVTLPDNITDISKDAFTYCSSDLKIYCRAGTKTEKAVRDAGSTLTLIY